MIEVAEGVSLAPFKLEVLHVEYDDRGSLRFVTLVYDRDSPLKPKEVRLHARLPAPCQYDLHYVKQARGEMMAHSLRGALLNLCAHEAAECVLLNGERAFETKGFHAYGES